MTATLILATAVFFACAVESVEATVITLAAASERGWRPALWGAGSAVAILAIAVAVGGVPLVRLVPIHILQACMGAGMLTVGYRWWRKATQRLAGIRSIKSEAQRYSDTVSEMRSSSRTGFLVAFQGTALEGMEVVIIALTTGTASRNLGVAGLSAVAAVLAVVGLALISRKQLNRLPEVHTKAIVSVCLLSFGVFWLGEGCGIRYPGSDACLLGIIALVALATVATVRTMKSQQKAEVAA